jgi:Helix-turn-helix domain
MDDVTRSTSGRNLSFTGAKLDWMTATAYDRRLRAINFRIPFVIAQHINGKTGKGFPSREEIADRAATSVETVKRAIRLLQETGWLRIRRKRTYDPKTKSWKTRNFYWLRYENVQTMFDAMADSKRNRRHGKRVMGDPRKRVMGDPLTPSYKHLQKGRESTEGEDIMKDDAKAIAEAFPFTTTVDYLIRLNEYRRLTSAGPGTKH